MTEERPSDYLELYDYRLRVHAMYAARNAALEAGDDPADVLNAFRRLKDELFATHPQSPIESDLRRGFTGLRYFTYDPTLTVEARLDTDVEPEELVVPAGSDGDVTLRRVAIALFPLAGDVYGLAIYWIAVYGGGLFLPFHDTTAPDDTYGGGRYLFDTVKGSSFRWRRDGGQERIVLDFNYAYNPSCAYSYRWACPLAPAENRLVVPIPAGEKVYLGEPPA